MKPQIYTIVLNWNGKGKTHDCLLSLTKATHEDFEHHILVVDNNSSDGSVEEVKEQFPDVEVLQNKQNFGYAGGNNVGLKHVLEKGAEYIFILNNDTVVAKDTIEVLYQFIKEKKNVGIVSPKIYFEKGYEFHKTRYMKEDLGKVIWYAGGKMDWANVIGTHEGVDEVDKEQYEEVQSLEFASGCAILINAEVLKKVGLFDERYFLYYEDNDLCMRIAKAGFLILFVPKAKLWHKNAGSAGGSGSDLQDYYISRNRLIFGMQYAPVRAKLALFRESIRLLFSGRKWQKQGIRDYYLRNYGKGSYFS